MKIFLRGELQHMAEAEMRDILDETAMAFVRANDPDPTIKVFKIAHEGETTGTLCGQSVKGLQYFKDAIKAIADRLPFGAKVFDGHSANADNSHAGREPIGQVVGKALKEIGGKLHAVAAMYIKPSARERNLDCASIETNLTFEPQGDGIRLVDLDEITGIALGDSDVVSPGFPGAELIGAFQAFEAKNNPKGGSTMTREEIQAAIREGNLKPSDLFDSETLYGDATVGKLLQTEVIKGQDLTKKLGEARSVAETLKAEKDATIRVLKAEALKVQHRPMFDGLATERNLNPQQKAFLDQRFPEFKTDAADEGGAKTALGEWINDGLKAFDETAKIFAGDGANGGGGQGQGDGGGMGAPAGDAPVINASNQSDPAVNRLIPDGAAAQAAGLSPAPAK